MAQPCTPSSALFSVGAQLNSGTVNTSLSSNHGCVVRCSAVVPPCWCRASLYPGYCLLLRSPAWNSQQGASGPWPHTVCNTVSLDAIALTHHDSEFHDR